MSSAPKFNFFEKIVVRSTDVKMSAYMEKQGVVLGRSQADNGQWYYSVHVYETQQCVHCAECELVSNGTFATADEFYDGTRIQIPGDGPSKMNYPE